MPPVLGHLLTILGWVVVIGLVIYGIYLLVVDRRGAQPCSYHPPRGHRMTARF